MLVARRELTAGRTLTAEDVRRASVPDRLLPASAASSAPPDVTGRAPAVDLPAGTLLTEALLAPERLDGAPAGTALVPVRLADDAVTALLRPGDRVDLLDATRPALAPESDAPAPDVSESIAAGPGAAASGAPTSAHGGASAPDSGSPATPSDQRVLARGALVMPQPAARAAAASPGLLGGAPTEDATSPLLLVAVQPSEAVAVAALSGRSAISAVIVR